MMKHRKVWLNLIVLCGLLMALGATIETRATDGGEGIIQENHSVPNVLHAFDDLVYWGEWLGFRKADAEYTEFVCIGIPAVIDPCMPTCPCIDTPTCTGMDQTRKQHFQGIARSPRTGVPPILFVTRAGGPDSWLNPSEGALWVLQMGSKSTSREQLGERLRSNRLAHNKETEDTVPPAADEVLYWIEFDQDYDGGSLDYHHPGGIQMVGDILAVSLEGPNSSRLPAGKIAFFNTEDPTALEHLSYLDIELPAGHKAAAVGITRLPDDHYGVVVATGGDTNTLEFYMSKETDIEDSNNEFQHYDTITKAELEDLADDRYWNFDPEPQSVNFVNEVGGALYLIGARNEDNNSPLFPGDNQLYLWEVTGFDEDKIDEPAEVREVSLVGKRKEVKKWLRSKGANIEIPCYTLFLNQLERQEGNFNAGAGAYVSPTGELLYYGTSFWNLGPGEIIRMAELHHKEVSHTGTCGPQFRPNHLDGPYSIPEASDLPLNGEVFTIEPWVSLYKHDGWDEQDMNERVMIDWADMRKDDCWLFNKLDGDFNDEVSSFRFCGPEGSYLELFDSKPTEDFSELDWEGPWDDAKDGPQGWISCSGTGEVYGTSDFDYLASEAPECQHHGDGSAEDFEEDTTSARFLWTPPTETYEWVLDGVPDPENPEPIEDGKRAIFHAGRGSSTHTVELTVWGETVSTEIDVYNVPPTITITAIAPSPADEGQVVTLSGEWSDPGAPDVTVTIGWGDGTTEEKTSECDDCTGPHRGSFASTHVYADNGIYPIQVCVNDGEDTTCESREIVVNNVAPTVDAGLDQVIYEGDVLTLDPAAFNDKGTLDTHTATVDWGDGSPPDTGVVSESPFGPPGSTAGADGTVEASHQYLVPPGDYTVTVCVTDDDGAETCDSLNVTVVHGFLRFCAYADAEHPGLTVHQGAVADCALVPSGIPGEMRPSGLGSRGEVDVKGRAAIQDILLSLADKIDVGKDASVCGTLTAGHDVKLDQRSQIHDSITSGHRVEVKRDAWVDGDITATDRVTVDPSATVTGAINEFASVPPIPAITFVQFSFEPGTEKVTVEKDTSLTLPPGSYKDVKVKQGATLILSGQVPFSQYVFKKFQMEKDTYLQFDLSNGPIVIDVADNLEFKDNVQAQIVSAGDARDILFRVAGHKVDLKKDGTYLGTFLAPSAEVKLGDDALLFGALYGKKVDIGQRVGITGMPARDIFARLFVNP